MRHTSANLNRWKFSKKFSIYKNNKKFRKIFRKYSKIIFFENFRKIFRNNAKIFLKNFESKNFRKSFRNIAKKKQHRSPNKSSKSEIGANFYNSLSIFANFRKILYFLFFIYSILYNNFFLFVKKIFKHLFFIFISQKLLKTFETFRNNKIFVYLFIFFYK